MPPFTTEYEFVQFVATHNGTVTMLVTPEIAGWMLTLNTGNRPLRPSRVERFEALLTGGGFVNTGEPVIFSAEGVVNDGQHRLQAIQESGIAAELDIRFGIARAAFTATGTGDKRSASDVLHIAGRSHTTASAAIARLILHYDAGTMGMCNRRAEPATVLRVVEAEPHLLEVATLIQGYRFAPARTAAFGMVLAVAARSTPMERVAAFAEIAASGATSDELDPARVLHVRLRDGVAARERMRQVDVAALAVRAWNAWIGERKLHRLLVQESDRSNAGFPKIAG